MKTLKLGQKIKVGRYECEVKLLTVYGCYLSLEGMVENSEIITQFITIDELKNKFTNLGEGHFPFCDSLEQLTEVVEYLKSFEKPKFKRGDKILVWDNDITSSSERIFFEYLDGNQSPFMCVDKSDEDCYENNTSFSTAMWKFAEPIPQPKQITKDEIKKAFDCTEFEIID